MSKKGNSVFCLPIFPQQQRGVVHGSFTRNSGHSQGLFASCNVGFDVGDSAENVRLNRKHIQSYLGFSLLVSSHQVHGNRVYQVKGPVEGDSEINGYDALITDQSDIGLMIQHADCQAVMLYDPKKRVIAAIHNGWRGSVVNIIANTITKMQSLYGSKAEVLLAAIGPSLGPCCGEFIHYSKELPRSFQAYMVEENHFDFWRISHDQLVECGVKPDSVHVQGICTSCSKDHFSYRRAKRETGGITGRNATVIALAS